MSPMSQPIVRPKNPCFSSGPCAKRPGWSVEALSNASLGRSHRATVGKAKLNAVIQRSRAILGVPEDYLVGIVPASDTTVRITSTNANKKKKQLQLQLQHRCAHLSHCVSTCSH